MRCIFCDEKVHTKWGIYCITHTSQDERKKAIFENKKNMLNNNDKWAIIGTNSSLESLRELAGLKNTISPQATDFRQLIKSITVMSDF